MFRIVIAAILAVIPLQTAASVFLNPAGAPPFSLANSDADVLPDVSVGPGPGPVVFDIVYTASVGSDMTGGGLVPVDAPWGFTLEIDDTGEFLGFGGFAFAPGISGSTTTGPAPTPFIEAFYTLGAALSADTIIATVELIVGAPLNDGLSDFTLSGEAGSSLSTDISVIDTTDVPLSLLPAASVDLQPVPLPATGLLMLGALALLAAGAARRKAEGGAPTDF